MALAFVLCLAVSAVDPDRASDVVVIPEFLATMLLSAATAVAILKYRLYDLDLVINRAAVYALLSAALVAVYVGAVALLGNLLGDPGVLAAGAVAVAVHPLRLRTQRAVNRAMYGDRDDPYLALTRLGDRLAATIAPHTVAETVVDTVAEALRVSNVGIELAGKDGFVSVASRGARTETGRYDAAIVHRGEPIGRLIVYPGAGRELSGADRRLLDALAGHVGAPLDAVLLTNELQRSRTRLIEAREEERRRIRRDLHDGLGPTLAGMGSSDRTRSSGCSRPTRRRRPRAGSASCRDQARASPRRCAAAWCTDCGPRRSMISGCSPRCASTQPASPPRPAGPTHRRSRSTCASMARTIFPRCRPRSRSPRTASRSRGDDERRATR